MRESPIEFQYLFCQALAEAGLNESENKKLKELRVESIISLYRRMLYYFERGFTVSLIEAIWIKKAAFILSAETKKDIVEILKPSVPYYDYCSFRPKSRFHVEEEELLMWSLASLEAPLNEDGFKRYMEIFRKLRPEQAKEVFG